MSTANEIEQPEATAADQVEQPETKATVAPVATEAGQTAAGLGVVLDDAETFPRSVVEKLRQENGRYRQRAGQADAYAARLHTELVRATGRLADPADLEFDAAHLDDAEALTEAIDALLADKPHLASRTPRGDIGQGQRGPASGSFSLLDTLKSLA